MFDIGADLQRAYDEGFKAGQETERPRAFGAGYKAGFDNGSRILRCKDCNRYVSDGGAMMVCDITGIPTSDYDFCSWAERIE